MVETWFKKRNDLDQGHKIKTGVVEAWFKQGNDLDQGHKVKTGVVETWLKKRKDLDPGHTAHNAIRPQGMISILKTKLKTIIERKTEQFSETTV